VKKASTEIEKQVAEFLAKGGKVTVVAPKKLRRIGFTAQGGSPKRRIEDRWNQGFDGKAIN